MAENFESQEKNAAIPDFVSDCRLMLRFARRNGVDLSPELEHEIAQLDSTLIRLNLPPVTDIPVVLAAESGPSALENLPKQPPPQAPPAATLVATSDLPLGAVTDAQLEPEVAAPIKSAVAAAETPPLSSTEQILKVHAELSRIVAPATALSLQTSEPPPGRHTFLGGMPLLVKAAAIAALVCALGFVASAGFIAQKAAEEAQKKADVAKKTAGDSAKQGAEKQKASVGGLRQEQNPDTSPSVGGNDQAGKP